MALSIGNPRVPGIAMALTLAGCAPTTDELKAPEEREPPPEVEGKGYHPAPDLADIPDNRFGEAVRRGRMAFVETREHAGQYVGNGQNCVNCHLGAGTVANSAPLWGAWPLYPQYRAKNDQVNTMDGRIRACFTYSMNAQDSEAGHPPPPDSPLIKDMQAYMFWMAQGARVGKRPPGHGYQAIPKPEDGYSLTRGEAIYTEQCALCHGEDGQGQFTADGTQIFPPLWGPKAYNWGAGMHRINTAAAFIKYNMPLGKANPVERHATLSDRQAWDVAAFINSHERPQDPRFKGSVAGTAEKWHNHECLYNSEVRGHKIGQGVK